MTEKFPFSLPAMEIVLAMGPEFLWGFLRELLFTAYLFLAI